MPETQDLAADSLTPSSGVAPSSAASPPSCRRRRPSSPDAAGSQRPGGAHTEGNRRKSAKVSRACDFCKAKKLKCSGAIPCNVCTTRGLECLFEARYRRGRPPTPPSSGAQRRAGSVALAPGNHEAGSLSDLQAAGTRSSPRPIVSPPLREEKTGGPTPNSQHGPGRQQRAEPVAASNPPEPPSHLGSRCASSQQGLVSRASPELESAEIEGQFFDPTSNLTFVHRAWKRFSLQRGDSMLQTMTGSESSQPLTSAGDRPFPAQLGQRPAVPSRDVALGLFSFYFEHCVVTYRCIHQYQSMSWLEMLLSNAENLLPVHSHIGHARAALVMYILAIASLRQGKISGGTVAGAPSSATSDEYFMTASALVGDESGLARLESVQARVLQVLYLLQSGRMNQSWYAFGSTVPMVSALGLHRHRDRNRERRGGPANSPSRDYVAVQYRKRTFWVVYTIDKYLAVVLGRPSFYHDDSIDQTYPDRINDQDMSPHGPLPNEPAMDCHVDSLIHHAKISRIIDAICREVYSLKPIRKGERLLAARRFVEELHKWRQDMPTHLGAVRPQSLISCFRRQAMALRLAYCHAIMHASRPFIMRTERELASGVGGSADDIMAECISAARMALETVDVIAADGVVFHAFWWTSYVTFCALAVVYVWEIQQRTRGSSSQSADPSLFTLAERCQARLTTGPGPADSPSRRYGIIIEELRLGARQGSLRDAPLPAGYPYEQVESEPIPMDADMFPNYDSAGCVAIPQLLSEWQATDWLELDSSLGLLVFGQILDTVTSPYKYGEVPETLDV